MSDDWTGQEGPVGDFVWGPWLIFPSMGAVRATAG
jgi:hypothetical protein